MATRIGLLRARGRSHGAQLLHGQQQLCGSISSASTNTSVRLLARLSSSHAAAVGSSACNSSYSASAPAARSSGAPSRRGQQQQLRSSLFSATNQSSSCKALCSSTARPAHDDAEGEAVVHSSKPAQLTFDGGNNEDRLARLDDGDKVCVCVCVCVCAARAMRVFEEMFRPHNLQFAAVGLRGCGTLSHIKLSVTLSPPWNYQAHEALE